jgi:hypothetical protein
MNAHIEQAFQKNDTEFLKLSNLAMTYSVADLKRLKTECIKHAEEIFNKKDAKLEETAHANMLLNFAECELAGIEL